MQETQNQDENIELAAIDILSSFFPRIQEDLYPIIKRFNKDYTESFAKKPKLTLNELTEKFPRTYCGYRECVDRFVNFGRHAPYSAVILLQKILPNQLDNNFYNEICQQIQPSQQFKPFLDMFLIIYFADCAAQVLSVDSNIPSWNTLVDIGQKLVKLPIETPELMNMRIQAVKQFSVIFSLISFNHAGDLLNGFKSVFESSDPVLSLVLYRFIRLTASESVNISDITNFLKYFVEIEESNHKRADVSKAWATSLCTLMAQLNTDGLPALVQPLQSIFNVAEKQSHSRVVDHHFLLLCATILLRDSSLHQTHYRTFLEENILKKAAKPHRTLGALHAFLAVLRGHYVSRGTLFWEWGSFNANGRSGIEVTHLSDASQDQSDPDSYTNLFLKYFVDSKAPIDSYPELVGQILLNLAARDFAFFCMETLPNFIQKITPDRALFSLHECMAAIVNPDLHFSDWAQQNPLNSKTPIESMIPTVFNQIKPSLFTIQKKISDPELTHLAFNFNVDDSLDFPVFTLPIKRAPQFSAMLDRISKSTAKVESMLDTFGLHLQSEKSAVDVSSQNVESVPDPKDHALIKMLQFYPHMLTNQDLQSDDRCKKLVTYCLARSRPVALFSVDVLNYFYTAVPENRLLILSTILESALEMQGNDNHLFLLLTLLLKLLDLSLAPKCATEKALEFVDRAEVVIIVLLASQVAAVRDMLLNLIERIQRFAEGFSSESTLFRLIFEHEKEMSLAVRARLVMKTRHQLPKESDPLITFREAADSKYSFVFGVFLGELLTIIAARQLEFIESIQKVIIDLPETTLEQANILFHTLYFDNESVERILELFPNAKLSFYDISCLDNPRRRIQIGEKGLSKGIAVFKTILANHAGEENYLSIAHFTSIAVLFPTFLKWATQNDNLLQVARTLEALTENSDCTFVFAASPSALSSVSTIFQILDARLKKSVDVSLATAYCNIIFNISNAVAIETVQSSTGPLRSRVFPSFCSGDIELAVQFLAKWSKKEEISHAASSALAAMLRAGSIPLVESLDHKIIRNALLEAEEANWPTLRLALFNHFESLLVFYLDRCNSSRMNFFKAIYELFSYQPLSLRYLQRGRDPLPEPKGQCTNEEAAFTRVVLKHAGAIYACASTFLIHEDYDTRLCAFKLIKRLSLLLQVSYQKEQISGLLDSFSDKFTFSFAAVTPHLGLQVSKAFYSLVPEISLPVVNECIRSLKNSAPTRHMYILQTAAIFMGGVVFAYNLMTELLTAYKRVDQSAMGSYLALWHTSDSDEKCHLLSFLLEAAEKKEYAGPVKAILVSIAQNDQKVTKSIVNHLTFAYWFYRNVQGHLTDDSPPKLIGKTASTIIIEALFEIAQISIDTLKPFLPTILTYALIHGGESEATLLSALGEEDSNISHLTTSLEEKYGKAFIKHWGSETLRWACGCGNMEVATRAAEVFSVILKPFDGKILMSIINSASVVASCPQSQQSIDYLMAVFRILTGAVDRYHDKQQFAKPFELVYNVARPFISISNPGSLSTTALSVVAKYVLYAHPPDSEVIGLLDDLAYLSVALPNRRVVDGTFLAIFKSYNSSEVISRSFLLFLPWLLVAFAAYHNVEPYSSRLGNDELITIIQVSDMMAHHPALLDDSSNFLVSALSRPAEVTHEDVARTIAADFASHDKPAVMAVALNLIKMATYAKDASMIGALFTLIRCLVESLADGGAFAKIVPIAANHNTLEARKLLESMVKGSLKSRLNPMEIDGQIGKVREWDSVATEIDKACAKQERMSLPNGKDALENPIVVVPVETVMWCELHVAKARNEMEAIEVEPFTEEARLLERFKRKKQKIVDSVVVLDPLKYTISDKK